MKNFVSVVLILIAITSTHGQDSSSLFDYQKVEPSASVVIAYYPDSVTLLNKVVLDGIGSKIPFYHFINKRSPNPPCVFLLHGLSGSKEEWLYPSLPYLEHEKNLVKIKDSLLALGYSLVIPDAKFHGERTYELNFRNPGYLPPQFSKSKEDAQLLYETYVSTIKEIRLIMDYLEKESGTDDRSYFMVGYSMGGAIGLLLNTVEDRLSGVVACVPPVSRPYSEVVALEWDGPITKDMKAISPAFAISQQLAPVTLLMGRTDYFTSEEEARAFVKSIPGNDKSLKLYNAGHELPGSFSDDVIKWITEQTAD